MAIVGPRVALLLVVKQPRHAACEVEATPRMRDWGSRSCARASWGARVWSRARNHGRSRVSKGRVRRSWSEQIVAEQSYPGRRNSAKGQGTPAEDCHGSNRARQLMLCLCRMRYGGCRARCRAVCANCGPEAETESGQYRRRCTPNRCAVCAHAITKIQ